MLVTIGLEGSGEPPIPYSFPVGTGFDGRYNRAVAPKFTKNGLYPLVVIATDALGRQGSARCLPGILVTF